MYVYSVTKTAQETQEMVKFFCVSDKGYGPEGESEDNTFARYTPTGECQLTIANPSLIGKLKPGSKFYIDFTPAE